MHANCLTTIGLGTSTAAEAKEYFENMARHRIRFRYDGEQDDQNIIMAFSKKCVDQRKDWLTNHMEETKRRKEIGLGERYLYEKDTRAVSYSDFINVELVLFRLEYIHFKSEILNIVTLDVNKIVILVTTII